MDPAGGDRPRGPKAGAAVRKDVRAVCGRRPRRSSGGRSESLSPPPSQFEIVRDPLWNNIRLEAEALAVIDTPGFQRLRYVRQLGHAFLVYPGATHTRFQHALGTYHLARPSTP